MQIQSSINEELDWINNRLRDAEGLMGFDQEFMERLGTTLGSWDDSSLPKRLIELLPKKVRYPFVNSRSRTSLYDHQIHLLVEGLVDLLKRDDLYHDNVVKQCAHLRLFNKHAAPLASSDLFLRQSVSDR